VADATLNFMLAPRLARHGAHFNSYRTLCTRGAPSNHESAADRKGSDNNDGSFGDGELHRQDWRLQTFARDIAGVAAVGGLAAVAYNLFGGNATPVEHKGGRENVNIKSAPFDMAQARQVHAARLEADAEELHRRLDNADERRREHLRTRVETDAIALRSKLEAKDVARRKEFETRHEAEAATLRAKLERAEVQHREVLQGKVEADAAALRAKLAAKDAAREAEFNTRVEADVARLREKLA
jgi:hypothetical protein